ncbi:hypothetical protein A2160_04985 [Candidatus Beckwithbacteria bacterium RBG_13_42_9]|uniref:Uncharacterized protein n=1 Tax=Candidatus Beckwithbacteria bacterium RBG_13_42_9 TaxID=1797457 RepID=A0A1F5E5P6_9BACT|nr:MAG: hypothetical protein A2160_04985 [Candidatus Beckwithbacteria bacterium RBG_13_42_9]
MEHHNFWVVVDGSQHKIYSDPKAAAPLIAAHPGKEAQWFCLSSECPEGGIHQGAAAEVFLDASLHFDETRGQHPIDVSIVTSNPQLHISDV